MSKPKYTDICIARASAATDGPWSKVSNYWVYSKKHQNACPDGSVIARTDATLVTPEIECKDNSTFITHARTDVPELCKRLNLAIERLRELSAKRRDDEFIAELEKPLGDDE